MLLSAEGKVVGEGFHAKAGEAHAEVAALKQAGEQAVGGTIYVNLEPCCHQGRTGPCTEALIESGVKEIVCAMEDPNPKVAGKGFQRLKAAGLNIRTGILQEESRWINRAFIKTICLNEPWLVLKIAATLDGKIADRNGTSRWITGTDARAEVHRLRDRLDAILVGLATIEKDNPELTVRQIEGSRNPQRLILDFGLGISLSAKVLNSDSDTKTIIYTSNQAMTKRSPAELKSLTQRAQLVAVCDQIPGKQSEKDEALKAAFAEIMKLRLNSLLCEGGGRLAGALLGLSLVDELQWFIAPKLLGDNAGISACQSERERNLENIWRLEQASWHNLGEELICHGLMGNKLGLEKPF